MRKLIIHLVWVTFLVITQPCFGSDSTIRLSPDEKSWIGNNHIVRVRIGNSPPFMFTEGEIRGIAIDYLTHIFDLNGVKFQYIKESEVTWPQALKYIEQHEVVDMVPTAKITEERKKYMVFTDEYIVAPWVIFTNSNTDFISSLDDLKGKTVSVEEGYVIHEKLKRDYPGIKLKVASAKLKDYAEIPIRDLSTGLVDAYIGNLLSTAYLIQTNGYANVKVAAPTPFENHNQAMAIRNDWPELAGIINKTLAAMTPEEHAAIRNKWLTVRYECGISIQDVIKWLLITAGIAALFIGFVLVWNKRLQSEVALRKIIEAALRDREFELEEAQLLAGTGSWTYDPVIQKSTWSKGMFHLWGLDPALGLFPVSEHQKYIHPDDFTRFEDALREAVEHGIPYKLELRLNRPDGIGKTIITICEPQLDPSGKVVKLRGTNQDITERKIAEDALRESEAFHASLLQAIPIPVCYKDTAGRYLEFNSAFEEFLGKAKDQLTGKTVFDLYPQEIAQIIHSKDIELFEKQGTQVYESKIYGFQNFLHDVIFFKASLVNSNGVITGLIGTILDITERKQAEEALRKSDERHRKYLMNAPYGIFVTDEKGRYQQVNPAACNMSGYEEQELLAMGIADLFFEESIEEGLRHFERALHQGQSQGELLFRRKNGERQWWSVNAVKISDTQFLGFCIDVTERKQAEDVIQKRILSLTQPMEYSEVRLEDLFNLDELQVIQDQFALATGVSSIITRIDGTPVTSPSNFTRLCSEIIRKTEQGCANCVKSDAVIGRHNPDGPIIQPCLSGGLWNGGVNIVVGGHHIANWMFGQVRNEAQSEDGLRAYAALIGIDVETFMQAFFEVPSMSYERFGFIAQALFTLVNQLCNTAYQNVHQARFIAERKQAEEEKSKLQAQLTQAQKMEAVGQLAGGVAHDFNNMLGVIIGYSELILEQVDPSQQFHAELEEIMKAARRSADLTRQLLTFARKQTVAPHVLDLNQTIEGMLNMLRRLIGENITLIWMPGSGLWPINMDPSQIDQILANLCVNARDAIAGVGKLTVETENITFDKEYCEGHAGALPGEYVRIAVSDTGSGMDKETLAHIFEPFFTTKDVGEGTGLGLATVYGAVKQNNGFINAYSEPGQGTTFTIYIPRHVETTQKQIAESVKPVLHGDEIIMLVEDEPTLLEMSKRMLERLGYNVLTASTPREAIRLAGEYSGQIHLLATDVIMPEMNGRELAERLAESRPEMKRLFMSGYTANIIANQGVLKEGVSFIQKPFSKNQLAVKVRAALTSPGSFNNG